MKKIRNTSKLSKTNQIVITALCIALCAVLPFAFHSIPMGGAIYCPMHIPVLICGIVCNWQAAMLCGIIGPVISCLTTGMPNSATLPTMMIELAVYGLVAGLMMKHVSTKSSIADVYISLVTAMISGRIVGALAKALIFAKGAQTIEALATAYFVTCLPGIVIHLILVPAVYFALQKSGLIAKRYIKEAVPNNE